MSDFLYSREIIPQEKMVENFNQIYSYKAPKIVYYEGKWGCVVTSMNHYNGFSPYETDDHIFIVLGGPVLTFQHNNFLDTSDINTDGTRAISKKILKEQLNPGDDLSGPFAIFVINKQNYEIQCITDLMSFIPIYSCLRNDNLFLGSHLDALAKTSEENGTLDRVSRIEFLLQGSITFPYTTFKNLRQLAPASKIVFSSKNIESVTKYWLPKEEFGFKDINEAANVLKNGLEKYIRAIVTEKDEIAQFISGGEDSRLVLGFLTKFIKPPESYIFLDAFNREGKIAKKAAFLYGANFNLKFREENHYINNFNKTHNLIGSNYEFHQVHTYGFHTECNLMKYKGVFGGLLSDTFLKGHFIKKHKQGLLSFDLESKDENVVQIEPILHNLIKENILEELNVRRFQYFEYIKSFRNNSALEWFKIWPNSQNTYSGNIQGNRRLFKSYEPFTSLDIVKNCAIIPQEWKLNRLVFNKLSFEYLEKSKWLQHTDGHFPYFGSGINKFLRVPFEIRQRWNYKMGINDGSWSNWYKITHSKGWVELNNKHHFKEVDDYFKINDIDAIMIGLNSSQRARFYQLKF